MIRFSHLLLSFILVAHLVVLGATAQAIDPRCEQHNQTCPSFTKFTSCKNETDSTIINIPNGPLYCPHGSQECVTRSTGFSCKIWGFCGIRKMNCSQPSNSSSETMDHRYCHLAPPCPTCGCAPTTIYVTARIPTPAPVPPPVAWQAPNGASHNMVSWLNVLTPLITGILIAYLALEPATPVFYSIGWSDLGGDPDPGSCEAREITRATWSDQHTGKDIVLTKTIVLAGCPHMDWSTGNEYEEVPIQHQVCNQTNVAILRKPSRLSAQAIEYRDTLNQSPCAVVGQVDGFPIQVLRTGNSTDILRILGNCSYFEAAFMHMGEAGGKLDVGLARSVFDSDVFNAQFNCQKTEKSSMGNIAVAILGVVGALGGVVSATMTEKEFNRRQSVVEGKVVAVGSA